MIESTRAASNKNKSRNGIPTKLDTLRLRFPTFSAKMATIVPLTQQVKTMSKPQQDNDSSQLHSSLGSPVRALLNGIF